MPADYRAVNRLLALVCRAGSAAYLEVVHSLNRSARDAIVAWVGGSLDAA